VRSAASASDPAAEEAASRILKAGGTAGEALIAGFLCAAAVRRGGLLAPLQALIAGPGVGARAFDGRSRQPGLGVPRPRGFLPDQLIPDAAYVAVPGGIAALSVLHAHDPSMSFSRLAEPGVEHASALGARERSALIKRVGQAGPSALREPGFLRPLLAVGGRAEGGVLSEEDLAAVRPGSGPPRESLIASDRRALLLPWPQPLGHTRPAEVIVAADARGVLGALAYVPDEEGIAVPELGLTAPRDAVVVRRGIPRLPPGDVLPCVGALAIALADARPFLAVGVRANLPIDESLLLGAWADHGASVGHLLRMAQSTARGLSAHGVMRSLTGDDAAKVSPTEG
jgi:gamma-glutamyltranspeptidase/glutathione hydrolase